MSFEEVCHNIKGFIYYIDINCEEKKKQLEKGFFEGKGRFDNTQHT